MDNYELTAKELQVVFDNNLNKRAFPPMSPAEHNLLMGLIGKMKNKGTEKIVISAEEGYILSGEKVLHPKELSVLVNSIWDKISTVNYNIYNHSDSDLEPIAGGGISLFSYLVFNAEQSEIKFSINPDLAHFVNSFEDGNYTTFSHDDFNKTSTSYGKTLFKLLSQYKETGYYVVKSEELRCLMACPKSYRTSQFHERVLEKAMRDIDPFFKELKVEKVMRSKRIVRYEFKFKKIKNTKKWDEGFSKQKAAKKSSVKEVNPTYVKQEDGDMSMEEYAHEVEKLFVK